MNICTGFLPEREECVMKFIGTIKLKPLLLSLLIPLGLGGAVGLFLALTGQFNDYGELFQPPLSPPPWVFFAAWVILYALMGISSYLVLTADVPVGTRSDALWLYFVQLGVNLIWPVLFFYFDMRLAAFLWLIVLIATVVRMIVSFWFISRPAALLQIPYILWLIFAAYLNGTTYILNG